MASPALQADYLFAGPLILERLRSQVAGVPWGDADAAAAADPKAAQPLAGFVLWDGELLAANADGQARGGASQIVDHVWTVLLRVRNAAQGRSGDGLLDHQAGPLLYAVHQALAGWSPEGALHPLRRAQARPPAYGTNSKLFFVSFQLRHAL